MPASGLGMITPSMNKRKDLMMIEASLANPIHVFTGTVSKSIHEQMAAAVRTRKFHTLSHHLFVFV